ncbi:hypothetical protein ABT354_13020 [Streptomyces sp. NPDC000594]|uniref:hypothetical protein n=1 Tax=Streptomyces sp. NPDC000594 TaxID=3154261 RepID=UPI0033261EBD
MSGPGRGGSGPRDGTAAGAGTGAADTGLTGTGVAGTGLDEVLARAHRALGIAVQDALTGRGGPPEPRDPDRALARLLASAHRQTLAAVEQRTDRLRQRERARRPARDGGLMSRPAAVRLKYREEALRIAREHRPQGLLTAVGRAQLAVQWLIGLLEEGRPAGRARGALARAGEELERALVLPRVPRLPPALTGYAFLETARERLGVRSGRLTERASGSLGLLETELLPRLDDSGSCGAGALEVALDLADDLDLVQRAGMALLRAVREAEEAGNDFRGADLRDVSLEGLPLEGIRWDARTLWPPGWESRVRRASLAIGEVPGVLVVGREPGDRTVRVDR